MSIYTQFAAWGLPCPISGHPNSGRFAGSSDSGSAGEAGSSGGGGGSGAGARAAA
jgi:hypothetical protein